MRKYALMAAALGMSVAGVAKAGFTLSVSGPITGTGNLTGYVVYDVFAKNDGAQGTTSIASSDTTLSDHNGALVYRATDTGFQDGMGNELFAADFDGSQATGNWAALGGSANLNHASYLHVGTLNGVLVGSTVIKWTSQSTNPTSPAATFSDFGHIGSFEALGNTTLLPSGGSPGIPANSGSGAFVGQAVVPVADLLVDPITFSGQLGDEMGNASNVSVTFNAVPEPASIGMLGIGAAGLLVRRRRGA